jgi:predicted nucleic acid-binding Zn ribbon protein
LKPENAPLVCKVCKAFMLPADRGRPPATCSERCRLTWKAARARAKRSQEKALSLLRMAAKELAEVEGAYSRDALRLAQRLSHETPSRLASISASEREWSWKPAL